MIHVPPRRGLGTFMVRDGAGNIIDCDSVSNVLNSACWGIFGGTGTPVTVGTPVTGTDGGAMAPGTPGSAAAAGGGQPYTVDCSQLVNQLNPATNCQNPLMGSLGPLLIGGVVLLVLLKR